MISAALALWKRLLITTTQNNSWEQQCDCEHSPFVIQQCCVHLFSPPSDKLLRDAIAVAENKYSLLHENVGLAKYYLSLKRFLDKHYSVVFHRDKLLFCVFFWREKSLRGGKKKPLENIYSICYFHWSSYPVLLLLTKNKIKKHHFR